MQFMIGWEIATNRLNLSYYQEKNSETNLLKLKDTLLRIAPLIK